MSDLPVRVYSQEPAIKRPRLLFREMSEDLKASKELSYALAVRDIKSQYRQSFLGYFWAFLPVLGSTLLFLFLKAGGAIQLTETQVPYLLYTMVGTTLWQLFVEGFNKPLQSVQGAKTMLTKINFPREALILSGMMVVGMNFLIRFVILLPVLIFYAMKGLFPLHIESLVLFPLGVLSLALLSLALGLLLVPVGLLFTDIAKATGMIISFWMFITPVVIPIPESGFASVVMRYNPVTPVLDSTRSWLLGQVPQFMDGYILTVALSFALSLLGWMILRITFPHIVSRLGM